MKDKNWQFRPKKLALDVMKTIKGGECVGNFIRVGPPRAAQNVFKRLR
jgi:hypothetical protein